MRLFKSLHWTPVFFITSLFSTFVFSQEMPCAPTASLIDFEEAIRLALCSNPQLKQDLLRAEIQASAFRVAESAYLPTVTASTAAVQQYIRNTSTQKDIALSAQLNLSWLLLDFGQRKALVDQNRYLFLALQNSYEATVLSVVAEIANAYFSMAAAQGLLNAKAENEKITLDSYKAVNSRYELGIGARADALQAKTAYSDAVLCRVQAAGNFEIAKGRLALLLGLNANQPLLISSLDETIEINNEPESFELLIEKALTDHPAIHAQRNLIEAASEQIEIARSEGLPNLSLQGNHTSQTIVGQNFNSDLYSTNIGLQVNIPLFEGFSRKHRIASTQFNLHLEESRLSQVERDIGLALWQNYATFKAYTESFKAATELVDSAAESSKVAQARYREGVSTLLELLNTQTALANARQQHVQVMANWHISRIQLAASVGNLIFTANRPSLQSAISEIYPQ